MIVSDGKGGGSGVSRRGPRRRWTDEEKRRIVAEIEATGASVSLVARRHNLNANMLFTWRREFRTLGSGTGSDPAAFVPAIISADDPALDRAAPASEGPSDLEAGSASRSAGRIEIVLGNSRRIIVDRDVSASALARVICVLERR